MTTAPTTGSAGQAVCWCCGAEQAAAELVRLGCHEEIGLCAGCIGWLGEQRRPGQMRRVVPILLSRDVKAALGHYAALGFETEEWSGGGYGFVSRNGVELHIGQPGDSDPATTAARCYLHVRDADALHAEWAAAGVAGELTAPVDTVYGMREGSHVDPDGNVVRFGSPLVGSQPRLDGTILLAADDPVVAAATAAVQAGDLEGLRRLLAEHPALASARIGDEARSRTLLHAATDWPGHFPNVAGVIAELVAAGADVNATFVGGHTETPLHWAASSDDVEALDALLDAGADLEAPGAVLGGGSPLADAVGFGQWQAARRLVEGGASTRLKDAAALGLMERVEALVVGDEAPDPELVTGALWAAVHGGQRRAAEYLIAHGADINWIGWDRLTPLDVAVREGHQELAGWLRSNGAKRASELG